MSKSFVDTPCKECPYRRHTGIRLMPDRIRELAYGPLQDDNFVFYCHKTIHDTDDFEEAERPQSVPMRAKLCAGHMAMAENVGRPTVAMRLLASMGVLHKGSIDGRQVYRTPEDMVRGGDVTKPTRRDYGWRERKVE